jgi:hypothetical protein
MKIYQWYVKVKDGSRWRDSGEGPFSTKQIAQDFIDAEVGVPAKVVKGKQQRENSAGRKATTKHLRNFTGTVTLKSGGVVIKGVQR